MLFSQHEEHEGFEEGSVGGSWIKVLLRVPRFFVLFVLKKECQNASVRRSWRKIA
jgi:hypothetical protein